MSFKIITKILANRLIGALNLLVKLNQCSFIKKRQSCDNIIIAQEIIYSIRNKKRIKGFVAIKVDMEKVFDRIDWSLIEQTLTDISLNREFVKITLSCISSASIPPEKLGKLTP